MKLDILIVDVALVALIFLPYVLFILIGRREERKIKNRFLEEALKINLTIEEKDFWNTTVVGLDITRSKVLITQKRKTGIVVELIDLKEIRSCEVLQEVQTVKISGHSENVVQRIDLQLELFNNSTRIVNFYHCEETYSQEYEMKHAERWSNKINNLIRLRPTVNSAA